ncbi:hypothetical protein AGMMS49959_05740 [Planctomycetales bacterium]|nr:hypothetical protein AGMMS49959_05740 [Planctomycetales bacterium]
MTTPRQDKAGQGSGRSLVTVALVVALALVGTALLGGGNWLRAVAAETVGVPPTAPDDKFTSLEDFLAAFADYRYFDDPSFYATGNSTTDNYFDRRMNLVAEADKDTKAVYEVRTRTFTLPLGAAVLMDYVYKDDYRGTGAAYPFPPAVDGGVGLFSGENAFTKNILPVYSDISEPTPPESEKLEEVGVMVWYQSAPRYAYEDTAQESPIYDNQGFIGGWNEPRFDISANGVAVGCSCYNAISSEVKTLMQKPNVLPSPYKEKAIDGIAAFILPVPMTKTQIENALNARPLQPLPLSSDEIREILARNPIMGYGASRDAGHTVSQWAVYNKDTAPYYEIRYGDAANDTNGRIQTGSTGVSSNVNYLLDGVFDNNSEKYTLKLIPFDPKDKLLCTVTCDGPNYDEINGNEEIHLNSCDDLEQTNDDRYIQFGCPSRANEFALGKFLTVKKTLDAGGNVTGEINKYGVTEQGQFTAAINDIVASFSADDILNRVKKIDSIDKIDADTGISDNSAAVEIDAATKNKLADDDTEDAEPMYAALTDLYRLTRDGATNPEWLKKYEKARFVANGGVMDTPSSLDGGRNQFAYDKFNNKPSIKGRFRYFQSFQEVGVNLSDVNQTEPPEEAEPATGGVIENSLPFNIKQFADKGLFDENGEPVRIVLDGGTPKWLIAAAVGYQLFNSPAAKIRRDNNIAQTAGVGAIYSVDYVGTYALDHRHLSDTTPIFTGGGGGAPTDRTPRNLDLLAFAAPFSGYNAPDSGYKVNTDSPFNDDGRDARTVGAWNGGARTGTGTCVIGRYLTPKDITPGAPLTNDCFAIPGWTCIKEAWVLASRYENTLRTHNELAGMIDVIAENGAKPIANIIAAIYADSRVGYDAAAARSRPVDNGDKIIGGATAGSPDGASENPPAGSIEINPQAVKNAAIERVVLNLFGAKAYNDHTPNKFLGATIINLAAAAENEKIQDGGTGANDNLYQGYIFAKADDYYRVLVATALINIGKQTVVSKKFLQFVYKKKQNGSGAVVDNHWLDPE